MTDEHGAAGSECQSQPVPGYKLPLQVDLHTSGHWDMEAGVCPAWEEGKGAQTGWGGGRPPHGTPALQQPYK